MGFDHDRDRLRLRAEASWLRRANLAVVLAIAPFGLTLRG
jgi:hypothetical protein